MVHKVVDRFAAVRETVGDKVDVAIDFHGRVSPAMSIRLLKVLEPYYPVFVEEPVLPENVDAMVSVARSTTIPIAGRRAPVWQMGVSGSDRKAGGGCGAT